MNSVLQKNKEKVKKFPNPKENPSAEPMKLSTVKGKKVVADFDGGQISTDAGALLLKETEKQVGIIEDIEAALNDKRDQRYVDTHCPSCFNSGHFKSPAVMKTPMILTPSEMTPSSRCAPTKRPKAMTPCLPNPQSAVLKMHPHELNFTESLWLL